MQMFAYTTALNYLLTQSKYVKLLGDTTVVYWSEDADIECKDLFLAASEPTTDNQELLDGVFSNLEKGYAVDVDSVYKNINLNQRFYILGIAQMQHVCRFDFSIQMSLEKFFNI